MSCSYYQGKVNFIHEWAEWWTRDTIFQLRVTVRQNCCLILYSKEKKRKQKTSHLFYEWWAMPCRQNRWSHSPHRWRLWAGRQSTRTAGDGSLPGPVASTRGRTGDPCHPWSIRPDVAAWQQSDLNEKLMERTHIKTTSVCSYPSKLLRYLFQKGIHAFLRTKKHKISSRSTNPVNLRYNLNSSHEYAELSAHHILKCSFSMVWRIQACFLQEHVYCIAIACTTAFALVNFSCIPVHTARSSLVSVDGLVEVQQKHKFNRTFWDWWTEPIACPVHRNSSRTGSFRMHESSEGGAWTWAMVMVGGHQLPICDGAALRYKITWRWLWVKQGYIKGTCGTAAIPNYNVKGRRSNVK